MKTNKSPFTKILIIAPQVLPVPATQGGAVETLLTDFIIYNEQFKRARLFIVTKREKFNNNSKFNMAKFFYFDARFGHIFFKWILLFAYVCWFVFRKLFHRKENVNYNLFGFYINRIAHRIHPDLVLSEGYDKITRLWQISRLVGAEKCYYHLHYSKKHNPIERKLFMNTITPSKYVLDLWCSGTSNLGDNTIVYNGINLDSFSRESVDSDSIRTLKTRLGIRQTDFIVIFVGRFRPGKGLIELLKAFDLLHDKSIKLLLIGDFIKTCHDESRFEKDVISFIDANKSIIRVGWVSQDKLPVYYSISDIQIVPSICEEAAGLVAIEGMSFGLPIIATKSGGLPEYINTYCSIQLSIDEKLPLNISVAIKKLKLDYNLRKKMSIEAKKRSLLFSKDKYCIELMDFLLK